MKNPNSSTERLGFFCRPNHIRVKTPHGTRLTAHRSIGAALHTLDHQFSKSDDTKLPTQTPMLPAGRGRVKGGSHLGLALGRHNHPSPDPQARSPPDPTPPSEIRPLPLLAPAEPPQPLAHPRPGPHR